MRERSDAPMVDRLGLVQQAIRSAVQQLAFACVAIGYGSAQMTDRFSRDGFCDVELSLCWCTVCWCTEEQPHLVGTGSYWEPDRTEHAEKFSIHMPLPASLHNLIPQLLAPKRETRCG